jgi:hypothetical protein
MLAASVELVHIMAVKGVREKKGFIVYQPPKKTPQQKRRDLIISLCFAIALVALVVFYVAWRSSAPSNPDTVNLVYDNTTPSVASQSHTTFYKNTATPYAAVNNNPYGYDFDNTGNLIYDEIPGDFCKYFKCASDFWSSTRNGYVVECADGQYTRTGGYANVCAGHGGKNHTLYWH